jgi:hypothetical protein
MTSGAFGPLAAPPAVRHQRDHSGWQYSASSGVVAAAAAADNKPKCWRRDTNSSEIRRSGDMCSVLALLSTTMQHATRLTASQNDAGLWRATRPPSAHCNHSSLRGVSVPDAHRVVERPVGQAPVGQHRQAVHGLRVPAHGDAAARAAARHAPDAHRVIGGAGSTAVTPARARG